MRKKLVSEFVTGAHLSTKALDRWLITSLTIIWVLLWLSV